MSKTEEKQKRAPRQATNQNSQTQTTTTTTAAAPPTGEKPKRKRRASKYLLEQGDPSTVSPRLWTEIGDGFASPKKALAHIVEDKLEGMFRVVRQVTPVVTGRLTTPAPIFSIEQVKVPAANPVPAGD